MYYLCAVENVCSGVYIKFLVAHKRMRRSVYILFGVLYRELAQSSCFVYFIIIICIAGCRRLVVVERLVRFASRVCTDIHVYTELYRLRRLRARSVVVVWWTTLRGASDICVYQSYTLPGAVLVVQGAWDEVVESFIPASTCFAARAYSFTSLHIYSPKRTSEFLAYTA